RPVTAPGARRKHRAGTGTVIATQPDRAASFRGARPEGDAAERPDATVRHRSAAPARTNRGHRAERDESGRSHHPARRPAGSRLIASCRALRGVDRSAPRTTRAPGDTGSFRPTVLRPRAVSIFSTPHACRTPPGPRSKPSRGTLPPPWPSSWMPVDDFPHPPRERLRHRPDVLHLPRERLRHRPDLLRLPRDGLRHRPDLVD